MINWYVVWTAWLIFLVISFAVLEGVALGTRGVTLSSYTWAITKAWPVLPFIVGFLSGFLACHFWWGGVIAFKEV